MHPGSNLLYIYHRDRTHVRVSATARAKSPQQESRLGALATSHMRMYEAPDSRRPPALHGPAALGHRAGAPRMRNRTAPQFPKKGCYLQGPKPNPSRVLQEPGPGRHKGPNAHASAPAPAPPPSLKAPIDPFPRRGGGRTPGGAYADAGQRPARGSQKRQTWVSFVSSEPSRLDRTPAVAN